MTGVGILIWFASNDHLLAGVVAAIAAMTIGGLIESRLPKWRCDVCGRTWSTDEP